MRRSLLQVVKLFIQLRRLHGVGSLHNRTDLHRDSTKLMGKVLPEPHQRDMQVPQHLRAGCVAHLAAPAILQHRQPHQHRCQRGHGYPSKKAFSGLWSGHRFQMRTLGYVATAGSGEKTLAISSLIIDSACL